MDAFCVSYSKILDYMIEIQDDTLNATSSKNKDIAVGYVKTLHQFKTYYCARLLQRLYNIVGPGNAEIQGRKCSVGGVRDKIMNLMGVMTAMGSEEQGLAFYEEVKSQAMNLRLEQPMTSRTQHLARWVVRGVRSELEIEQGAIDKVHAKIYAAIFEAAADGIAQRYPTEDLKLLVQLEEVICDSKSEFVGIICERYSSDLNGITPEVLRSHIKGTHEVIKQKLNDHTKTTFTTEECRVILKKNDVIKAACTAMDVLVRVFYHSDHQL